MKDWPQMSHNFSLACRLHVFLSLEPRCLLLPAGDAWVARPHSVCAALWPSSLPACQWDGQPQVSSPSLWIRIALTLFARNTYRPACSQVRSWNISAFIWVKVTLRDLPLSTVRRWSVCWTQRTLSTMPSEYNLNIGRMVPEMSLLFK